MLRVGVHGSREDELRKRDWGEELKKEENIGMPGRIDNRTQQESNDARSGTDPMSLFPLCDVFYQIHWHVFSAWTIHERQQVPQLSEGITLHFSFRHC